MVLGIIFNIVIFTKCSLLINAKLNKKYFVYNTRSSSRLIEPSLKIIKLHYVVILNLMQLYF